MGFAGYVGVFLLGVLLGLMYFGGLWWTVSAVARQRVPAWWLAVSFVLRVALLTAGLYLVLLISVWHLAACLIGWLVARMALMRFVGKPGGVPGAGVANPDGEHAEQ
jgi:F1F0 ATPase subunit 2